jgi:Zn-dependent protease with chaperone function
VGIDVTCSHCHASFRVKSEFAGRRGKCPHCQGIVQVPAIAQPEVETLGLKVLPEDTVTMARGEVVEGPEPAAAAVPRAPSVDPPAAETIAAKPADRRRLAPDVLAAFQGAIDPVEAPAAYRLGILLVAIVMVILPLVYVGLIVLVGYLVYLHAVNDTAILSMAGRGRGAFLALLVYLAPMITGGILVLFMIKPLFARPAKDTRRRSLTRDGEPLLFAFVDRVCQAVGAPQPRRIDVDCQVNASASFRRGLLSMFGSDLVLTIGMPLAAGLSLRQFAGVLGHEFGHFTQGAGMRLTYVIRSISWWFTRVVYERDAWDEKLIAAAQGLDLRISWVLHLARLMVWLTRKILWVLMMIGHAVSGYMLRQMEFDADRHEARLAGSDTFEATARRLLVLNVATQGAHSDLGEFYREGRLGDNLPRLILVNVDQLPQELLEKLNTMIDESKTGLLDTHPADKDRIAAARQENAPGVFRLELPAAVLFTDFETLSKNVTWDFYREIFGPQFKPTEMHPTEDLLARQGRELEANKALGRYFQGSFSTLRPLPLAGDAPAAPADPHACLAALKETRQQFAAARPGFVEALKEYDAADTRTIEADQATALLSAKFTIRQGTFSTAIPDRSAAARIRRDAEAHQQQLALQMAGLEQAAGQRLAAAVQLLGAPKVAGRIEGAGQLREECGQLWHVLARLNRHHAALLELRNAHASLTILLGNIQGHEDNQGLIEAVRSQAEKVLGLVKSLHASLMAIPYPFDHAKGDITVAQYALEKIPSADDLGAIYGAGESMLDKLPPLYARLAGRLVVAAEKVEVAVGLEPLPEPAPEKPQEAENP